MYFEPIGDVLFDGRLIEEPDGGTADRSEALITHVDAARALGGRILAGLSWPGGVAAVTMALDARADFPIAELGGLVRVDVDGGQLGQVTGITVRVSPAGDAMQMRQTLIFGEVQNDYQRLLRDLPRERRSLCQISISHADGTVTASPVGGGTLRARGTGTPGDWVWVKGGAVEASAPSLTAYALEV